MFSSDFASRFYSDVSPARAVILAGQVAVSVLFLVSTRSAYAQGEYLERGTSGVGIEGAYNYNQNAEAFGGSAGYSFFGVVDVGVTIFNASPRETIGGYSPSDFSYSPELTLHLIKQNDFDTPFSFAVSGSYERDSYSSDQLDKLNEKLYGDYFAIDGTIYGDINISHAAYLQPALLVGYVTGSDKLKYQDGSIETTKHDAAVYGIGLTIAGRNSPSGQVAFTPALMFEKKNTTLALSFEFIIETGHKS